MTKTLLGKWPLRIAVFAVLGLCLVLSPTRVVAATLPPVITTQPANQRIILQRTANFQVVVTSLSPLTYQWRKNGTTISGANASSYSITNVQFNDQGDYSVNVTNAGGWVLSSNANLTVYAQTAPTLDPTKVPALTAENEGAGAPSGAVGTLVSQLVDFAAPAGQVDNVTDPDNGALLGIAVTDANSSHGTWWYSTNNGSSWSALGAVNEMTARLLAADLPARLYFKPDTNWSGTLTNAITFRAWDQTTGSNGGTAVVHTNGTLLDTFSTAAYTNNNGTFAWNGNWVDMDSDGSANSGSIFVVKSSDTLEVTANNTTDSIHRGANLAGVATATVSFDYDSQLNAGIGGRIDFQVSTNNGTTYTTLATFSATTNFGTGTFSADLSSYATTNTRIRFATTGKSSPTERVDFDNVQIAFTWLSEGGTSAFSVATDSATLTVKSPNHAPVASNQSVSTLGGTAKLITLTGSDADNDPLTVSLVSGPTNGSLSGFNSTNRTVTYTPSPGYSGDDSFTFLVNDGTTNSAPATVSITVTPVAPAIANQPQGQTVVAGQNALLSVTANGTAPLSYQWQRNGAPLPGATNALLALNNVQPSAAGDYTVVVSNLAGLAPSTAAALTVIPLAPPSLGSGGMTANGFSFQLSVPVGFTYVILASTNLRDWTPISTNVAETASVVINDPSATNSVRRFYRALVQ